MSYLSSVFLSIEITVATLVMSGNLDEARLLFCDSQSRYRAHEPISELGKDFTYNVRNSNPFMVTKV